jgi:hypothetical protein
MKALGLIFIPKHFLMGLYMGGLAHEWAYLLGGRGLYIGQHLLLVIFIVPVNYSIQ